MNRFRMASLLSLAALLASGPALSQADQCQAILEQGIRNTYRDYRTGDFRQKIASDYCSQLETEKSLGRQRSGGVRILKFGGTAQSNKQQAERMFQKNCGSSENEMSNAQLESAMQDIADPGIVQAWSKCRSEGFGLLFLTEQGTRELIVTLKFRSAGAVVKTNLTKDLTIRNLYCEGYPKSGDEIDTGGTTFYCDRIPDSRGVIIANSAFQSTYLYVPPEEPRCNGECTDGEPAPAPPPCLSLAQFCAEWTGPGTPVWCMPPRPLLPGEQMPAQPPPFNPDRSIPAPTRSGLHICADQVPRGPSVR